MANRRTGADRHQRRRMTGSVVTVGAFLAFGLAPLAVAPGAAADDLGIDFDVPAPAADVGDVGVLPDHVLTANGYDESPLNGTPNPAAEAGAAGTYAAVPLTMKAGTEPVVDITVGSGKEIPVLVDTGSAGLNVPWYDLDWQTLLQFPTDMGFGAYSGGLGYFYVTMPTTVDFGDGIVTGTTSVNVILLSWPTSFDAWLTTGGTWDSFFAPAGVNGVLGIGPNAAGPTPGAIVTAALPGDWGKGVLIDQANHMMVFGGNPFSETGGATLATVDGAPIANLKVSIDGGAITPVTGIIDSGGVYGTMPSSVPGADGLGTGTHTITVYASDGTPLYHYDVTPGTAPTPVASGGTMNTGNWAFNVPTQPVYISNSPSGGQTIFGTLPLNWYSDHGLN